MYQCNGVGFNADFFALLYMSNFIMLKCGFQDCAHIFSTLNRLFQSQHFCLVTYYHSLNVPYRYGIFYQNQKGKKGSFSLPLTHKTFFMVICNFAYYLTDGSVQHMSRMLQYSPLNTMPPMLSTMNFYAFLSALMR